MRKVFLIGDSIRQGYDKYVRAAFEGVAEVYYPKCNCEHTITVIRYLYEWKCNLGLNEDVDVIHWNAGLWDALMMQDGIKLISLEEYKTNVDRICNLIKKLFPNAIMIYATSTPVIEEGFENFLGGVKRLNRDTEEYNAAASKIVSGHGGIVNDLYSVMKELPLSCHSDRTHFYTRMGTEVISNKVIRQIEDALNIKAKKLDFDEIYNCVIGEVKGE